MTTSPMSSSELEKEFASNRHGVRVKFDDEQRSLMAQTTIIKTEPYFQINSTEDQVTKHFYQNEFQSKDEKQNQFVKQISSKTLSKLDSLEEVYIVTFKQEKDTSFKPNDIHTEMYHKIIDVRHQISFSLPEKSVLKKPEKKEKIPTSKFDRSPSSFSLKKKQTFSSRSNSNEVQHLAKVTAKQTSSQPFPPLRSLFEPTINISDSSNSNQTSRP